MLLYSDMFVLVNNYMYVTSCKARITKTSITLDKPVLGGNSQIFFLTLERGWLLLVTK